MSRGYFIKKKPEERRSRETYSFSFLLLFLFLFYILLKNMVYFSKVLICAHRQVTEQEAQKFASDNGLEYIEASALMLINVKEVFYVAARAGMRAKNKLYSPVSITILGTREVGKVRRKRRKRKENEKKKKKNAST
jgi:hypothetical protein